MLALAELFNKFVQKIFGTENVELVATSFTRDCYGWIKPVLEAKVTEKGIY